MFQNSLIVFKQRETHCLLREGGLALMSLKGHSLQALLVRSRLGELAERKREHLLHVCSVSKIISLLLASFG